jgi:hypothetical protein
MMSICNTFVSPQAWTKPGWHQVRIVCWRPSIGNNCVFHNMMCYMDVLTPLNKAQE